LHGAKSACGIAETTPALMVRAVQATRITAVAKLVFYDVVKQ